MLSSKIVARVERRGVELDLRAIIEMHRLGMEIGAHGHRHAVLGRLDHEEADSDLSMCKQILEERVEASISSIAYPRGTTQKRLLAERVRSTW
jgi:peptidoglycan/xylan/chitin deacetylase (PgdA/CDA1 family)